MKRYQKLSFIFLVCTSMFITYTFVGMISQSGKNVKDFDNANLELSADPFLLTEEFVLSTNYISPESSPGSNDGVFFSFGANRNGNFTINIKNFPNLLTDTIEIEGEVGFDHPSGTNIWYISYLELDIEREDQTINRIGKYKIKLLISEDNGLTWEEKTAAEFIPSGTTFFELNYDLKETAVAAYPETGVIGTASWYNFSDLVFVNSVDNGTTWTQPKTIIQAVEIGTQSFFHPLRGPPIEVCILKNSTIYVLTQANKTNLTPIIYFESHDNGATWSTPKNVTISTGNFIEKIKMQVDHETGDQWLMWMARDQFSTYNITWAEYREVNNETLYSNVPTDIIYSGVEINFDFLYDKTNNIFRQIHIRKKLPENFYELLNFTCIGFGNPWVGDSLGYHDTLEDQFLSYTSLNFAYDGKTIQLFYEASYTGLTEVYQYYVYENPIFWTVKGFFTKNEHEQRFWNGRQNGIKPITISMVKVEFFAQNDTEIISETKYITIDNTIPYFREYIPNRDFFNPLASNTALSEISWDLLASEECKVVLEIFKEGTSLSEWQRVTSNNMHEMDPHIFRSNTGQLYILYRMIELGTSIIYLCKSMDNGITWSNPVEIARITKEASNLRYIGAAWGPVLVVYLRNVDINEDLLFRSFDEGNTFEPPILMTALNPTDKADKMILTNNGTLFLLQHKLLAEYTVIKSTNLGFNWSISASWKNHSLGFSNLYDLKSDMAYDYENDLLHIVLPYLNNSGEFGMQFKVANYTIATLNVSTNEWREPRGIGTNFPMGRMMREPKILIIKPSPIEPIQVKIRYIHDQEIFGSWTNYTVKEIRSTDLGITWSGPILVTSTNNATLFTSSIYDIFYVTQKSDGNDYEIYFSREGGLIRTIHDSLSSAVSSEVTFDGIDDFGQYIAEGQYAYNMIIMDDAGNHHNEQGWFYADYNAPAITNLATNWSFTPTPRLDVEISATITDDIPFIPSLYFKRDLGEWILRPMIHTGGDSYFAIIPRDDFTNAIQFYVQAEDLAGNVFVLDQNSLYYTYDMPHYEWFSTSLFNETSSYSSSREYNIEITITSDLEYVDKILFQYSFDDGTTWNVLELISNSPDFRGVLTEIPEDTSTLTYKVILLDIFGGETVLVDTQQIDFYPEIPSVVMTGPESLIVILISAIIGFLVAYGYIRLKNTSHDVIYRQIFLSAYKKRATTTDDTKTDKRKKRIKRKVDIIDDKEILLEKSTGATPFTLAFLGILIFTLIVFFVGSLISELNPQGGVLILAASLMLSIFGYMILISRDISLNIYLEKIYKRNMLLEFFQIGFMLFNIITLLQTGFMIPWFRYYLIEQTFDFGAFSIPKLYISVIGVFFTSLVLVIITTYIQLKKTVRNIQTQRSEGATDNILLYTKDQNSSRLITQMGYKTIAFLVTVLISVVTTTNILTAETGLALLAIVVPFILSGVLALILHRVVENRSQKKKTEKIELPFIDSKKICTNCGESTYLSNKYCGSCGHQIIYPESIGVFTSKCHKCNGLVYDKAEFCPHCGSKPKNTSIIQ